MRISGTLDKDVEMGGWGAATNGVLGSTGFGPCFGLLTIHQNANDQREATMFHISVDLSQEQKERLKDIHAMPGKKYGVLIVNARNVNEKGAITSYPKNVANKIAGLGGIARSLKLNEPITFDQRSMDMAYDIAQNRLSVEHPVGTDTKTVTPFTAKQISAVESPISQGRGV